MVVDGDIRVRTLVETSLKNALGEDYVIVGIGDGALAVETFKTSDYKPIALVLEVMLARKSGFFVLEQIKALFPNQKESPYFIYFTANQGKRHRQYAEALGADGYVIKPSKYNEMARAVGKVTGLVKKCLGV